MAKNKEQQVSTVRQAKHGWVLSIIFGVLSVVWILPILIVILNSFKRKAFIFRYPFGISSAKLSDGWDAFTAGMKQIFCGLQNYTNGLRQTNFWDCFGNSLFITVGSVLLIILCCSMCAWYIVRVKTKGTKIMYTLCLFSMIVPFQMVMFTLSKFANMLHLSNPLGIIIVYLGFGAGLAVFMFTGFVKGIPLEIEEAALIDGCSPLQVYFKVLVPILKPTIISTAILELMWVWNDYLLPTLVLDIKKYRTIPMAVQYFRGSYGHVQMGPMMASIMIDIIPIIIVYLVCQKYIIEGVVAGAVKG